MRAHMFGVVQLNASLVGPPPIPSPEFSSDLEYTLAFGRNNSTNRTAYETEPAKFWYDEDTGESICLSVSRLKALQMYLGLHE